MKKPIQLPTVGDRVKLKGRAPKGVIAAINADTKWTNVNWDAEFIGPKIVHLAELEKE